MHFCHFVKKKKTLMFQSASLKKLSLDFFLQLVSSIRTHLSYSTLEASLANSSSKDKVPYNSSESQKSTCDRANFFLTSTLPKTSVFNLFKNLLDFSTFLPKWNWGTPWNWGPSTKTSLHLWKLPPKATYFQT